MFAYYGFSTQIINSRVHELIEYVLAAGGTLLDKQERLQNKVQLAIIVYDLPLAVAESLQTNEWVYARLNGYEAKTIYPGELKENGGELGE